MLRTAIYLPRGQSHPRGMYAGHGVASRVHCCSLSPAVGYVVLYHILPHASESDVDGRATLVD